jgi:protein TonB
MGALLTARLGVGQRSLRERLPSLAISIIAHAAIAYVIIFAGITVMKTEEVQTINVMITPEIAQPEPQKKVVQLPDVKPSTVPEIAPPQIEIAAPPAPMAIQVALPQPPVPQQPAETKPIEEAAATPPRFDAPNLNNPATVYPNMSRRLREVGTVQLRVRVSAAGQALEIFMAKSSGYGRLDEAALAAVKKWKFQPAMRNGIAFEAWVLVPVEFSLTK